MPAQLLDIAVNRPLGMHDSNTISLHIFGHTTEQHELSVHDRVKCALWTHLDWNKASGWLAAEDVGWSPEPVGCSFIHQVETVNENGDISLPTLSKITLCCFYVRSSRRAGCRSSIDDVFCNSLKKGLSTRGKYNLKWRKVWVKTCKNIYVVETWVLNKKLI